jgi:NAD(P)-dependent dehydrogenase (short-subunit alcohol dehydrogenase family)
MTGDVRKTPRERMTGKVVLITGGASGIGRACALLFAAEGARICVAGRNRDAARSVCREVAAMGGTAVPIAVDVRVRDDCFEIVERCEVELGPIDSLVSCAGIWSARPPEPDSLLVSSSEADVRTVLDVNLFGTLFSNQAVAGAMKKDGRSGTIVNLASSSAKLPRPTRGPYAISKAGVWMLTKIMAVELAPAGIRVNALGPGYIETPMTAAFPAKAEDKWVLTSSSLADETPLGRPGTAGEVAEAALFLASDESSYFTGELLQPTGGLYLG